MEMRTRATLLSVQQQTSKKNNVYFVGLFYQGVDTLQIMLPEGVVNPAVQKEYDLLIDYNTKWKSLTLKDMHIIQDLKK